MKLRYIKHQSIEPKTFITDHNLKYDIPTLYCGFPSKPFLMITGDYKPEKYLITKNIPSDIPMIKVPIPKDVEAGVFYYSKDTIKIDFHIPKGIIKSSEMKKAIIVSIVKALEIDRKDFQFSGNDLFVKTKQGFKKFAGSFHCVLRDNDYYAIPLSYHIDYDLMRKMYKLDTEKMKRKGKITDIKDIVAGIADVKKIKDKNVFLDDFANLVSKRFDWEIIKSDFSEKEKDQLKKL